MQFVGNSTTVATPSSAASAAGVRSNDVIHSVNGAAIRSASDFFRALEKGNSEDGLGNLFSSLLSSNSSSSSSNSIRVCLWRESTISFLRNGGEPLGLVMEFAPGLGLIVKNTNPIGCAARAKDWLSTTHVVKAVNGTPVSSAQQISQLLPQTGQVNLQIWTDLVFTYSEAPAAATSNPPPSSSSSSFPSSSSSASAPPPASTEHRDNSDPSGWSVSKLKSALDAEFVDRSDCIEKTDLVNRVVSLQNANWDAAAAGLKTIARPSQNQSSQNAQRGGGGGGPFPSSSSSSSSSYQQGSTRATASSVLPAEFENVDFYELLGAPRDANPAQLRKCYYKIARECHPDKAGGDPRMEQKFKAVTLAYEVLSDPQKREAYDRHGREGVDMAAQMGKFDIKPMMRMVFGGGNFDAIFGDPCELPAIKQLMTQLDPQVALTEHATTHDVDWNRLQARAAMEAEELACRELSVFLLSRLEQHSSPSFVADQKTEALSLLESPGGVELLKCVSYIYIQEGEQYAGGIGGFFSEMQERAHLVAEGASVTAAAVGMMTKVKALERKQEQFAKLTSGQPMTQQDRMAAMMKARESEDVRRMEQELLDEGLQTVWRAGKLMIEQRVRKVVEMTFDPLKKEKSKLKHLAKALLKIGKVWEESAKEAERKQKFDIRNHVISSATAAAMDTQDIDVVRR